MSIESTVLHSHGLDFHSRVLLCGSVTGYAVWPERLVVLRRPAPGAAPVVVHVQRSDARGGSSLWTDEAEAFLEREFPQGATQ